MMRLSAKRRSVMNTDGRASSS